MTRRFNYVKITNKDEQELQEYVRKVLLMYWFISSTKKTFIHEEIVNEFQSEIYDTKFEYCSFLTALNNVSFEQKQSEILIQIFTMVLYTLSKFICVLLRGICLEF